MRITAMTGLFITSRSLGPRVRRRARKFWGALREWCGDAAYDRYLRSRVTRRDASCLSAEEFYLDELMRRYSRPNRCC